eukprot:367818_1
MWSSFTRKFTNWNRLSVVISPVPFAAVNSTTQPNNQPRHASNNGQQNYHLAQQQSQIRQYQLQKFGNYYNNTSNNRGNVNTLSTEDLNWLNHLVSLPTTNLGNNNNYGIQNHTHPTSINVPSGPQISHPIQVIHDAGSFGRNHSEPLAVPIQLAPPIPLP